VSDLNISDIKVQCEAGRQLRVPRDYGAFLLTVAVLRDFHFSFQGDTCVIAAPARQGDDHPCHR